MKSSFPYTAKSYYVDVWQIKVLGISTLFSSSKRVVFLQFSVCSTRIAFTILNIFFLSVSRKESSHCQSTVVFCVYQRLRRCTKTSTFSYISILFRAADILTYISSELKFDHYQQWGS